MPPLRPFVKCIWFRAIAGADPHNDRRILPDGRMDLVWIPGLGVLVAGPQSRYAERPDRFPLLAVGARFHPGGAPSLLGLPASDFVDGHVRLETIDQRLADRLDARLEGARDHREAFAAFDAELLRRLDGFVPADAAIQAGVRLLDTGSLTVAGLAAQLSVSERQLRRRFAERVGVRPEDAPADFPLPAVGGRSQVRETRARRRGGRRRLRRSGAPFARVGAASWTQPPGACRLDRPPVTVKPRRERSATRPRGRSARRRPPARRPREAPRWRSPRGGRSGHRRGAATPRR